MRDEKQFWTVSWSQPYTAYVVSNPEAKSQPQPEPELMDLDRKSTRLNSSHSQQSRMPSSA